MSDLNLLSPKLEPRERRLARRSLILSIFLLAVAAYLVLSYLALNAERRMLETERMSLERTIQETSKALSALTQKKPTYTELQELVRSLQGVPSDPTVPGKIATVSLLKAPAGVKPFTIHVRRDADTGRGTISISGQASSARAAERYADILKEALGFPRVDGLSLQHQMQENASTPYRFTLELTLEGWK